MTNKYNREFLLEYVESENKSKIIITTIQKLGHFIKQNKNHEVFRKNIVLIFD